MLIRMLYRTIRLSWGHWTGIWVYRAVKIFLNVFYPVYCKLVSYSPPLKSASKIIISLTSFPARIDRIWLVIETLLRQTYKPHKIVLWLANSQFHGVESLPGNLRKLQQKGLEIRFCEDLRSHKKYFYAMQDYPEFNVITVDDDTFYPEDLVEGLVECSEHHPGLVCCNLAHQIVSRDGMVSNYADWISGFDALQGPSAYLVPRGCEGVLYPSGTLDQRAFDRDAIERLCPIADDLWLKAMSTLNGVSAIRAHPYSFPFVNIIYPRSAGNFSLSEINNGKKMNDSQFSAIVDEYPGLIVIWASN